MVFYEKYAGYAKSEIWNVSLSDLYHIWNKNKVPNICFIDQSLFFL